jgi:O-antigen ligase
MLNILLSLIFIRPFISPLAYPKADLIYSLLLFGFIIIYTINRKINPYGIKPLRWPLLAFLFAQLISYIFSGHTLSGMQELYQFASCVAIFIVVASLSTHDKNRVFKCLIISGTFIALCAIYQYFFGFQHILNYVAKEKIQNPFIIEYVTRKRVFFPFVTPNTLASFASMVVILTLALKHRIWFILPLGLTLFLTQSLSALFSITIGIMIYFHLKNKSKKTRLIILFTTLIATATVLLLRIADQKQYLQPVFSALMRLNYWTNTIKIIEISPLIGVGMGNFNLVYSRYAHNFILQLWAEIGILGLVTFTWFIIALIKRALQPTNNQLPRKEMICLITASLVFLINNCFDFSFFLPEVSLIWWVILGLLI